MTMRFLLSVRKAGNHCLIAENMAFDLMGKWRQVTVGHGKASGKHKQGVMVIPFSSGCHVDFDVCSAIPVYMRPCTGMRIIAVLPIFATVCPNRDFHTLSRLAEQTIHAEGLIPLYTHGPRQFLQEVTT